MPPCGPQDHTSSTARLEPFRMGNGKYPNGRRFGVSGWLWPGAWMRSMPWRPRLMRPSPPLPRQGLLFQCKLSAQIAAQGPCTFQVLSIAGEFAAVLHIMTFPCRAIVCLGKGQLPRFLFKPAFQNSMKLRLVLTFAKRIRLVDEPGHFLAVLNQDHVELDGFFAAFFRVLTLTPPHPG